MATVTDNDLKELKDLIRSGFSRLDAEITDLKVSAGNIEATLQSQQPNIQKIPDCFFLLLIDLLGFDLELTLLSSFGGPLHC
jgi:hypothetical protein